ncbi:MAG: DUF134 domain-containing protein [Thermogutta sp.]
MPRPKRCRWVGLSPGSMLFKPAGVAARDCEQRVLPVDGLEALRLADFEGLYHEEAAERMGISRQTFGRILESARRTVAEALVKGMVLRIEGGLVQMVDVRAFACSDCGHTWEVPFGNARPEVCPACQSANFHRVETARSESFGKGGRCRRKRQGRTQGRCRGLRRGGTESQVKETET